MNRKAIVIWMVCLIAGIVTHAQITPVVTGDKEKILIGEPLKLTLELKAIERTADVKWKLPDSIPHFEYVSFDTADLLKREITISSFDSGVWTIDNIAVVVPSNVHGKPQLLKFPPKEIRVDYDTTGNQLMNDVKPIIEINSMEYWIGYVVVAAALLCLIILVVLIIRWKKKKVVPVDKDDSLTALESFQQTVAKLEKQSWDKQLEQKQNFTELSQAIKKYFERKLHQPFSKLTTDELVIELRLYLSNEQLIALAQNLRLSDAVKFAKFAAPQQDCITALKETASIIRQADKQVNQDV
jgi:hypothetical protein